MYCDCNDVLVRYDSEIKHNKCEDCWRPLSAAEHERHKKQKEDEGASDKIRN